MIHAYLFEAKGVQRYLFTSGRLRDVVGASDLVGRIAASDGDDLIGLVLAAEAIKSTIVYEVTSASGANEVSFSRRAGAAFCLHCSCRKTLVNIRREMRLRVMSALPGLEISDALASSDDHWNSLKPEILQNARTEYGDEIASMKAAFAAGGGARANMAASILPLGRPVTAIVPRTGMPMVTFKAYGSDNEPIDMILRAQRDRADIMQSKMGSYAIDGVAERFNGNAEHNAQYVYPRNLDDKDPDSVGNPIFPWREDSDRRVGLIHADLSGLGEAFSNAGSMTAKENLDLGKKIEDAIVAAIVTTNGEVLRPQSKDHGEFRQIVPARPVVIGGDDITLIVRADLAAPFAARFLELIEELTKDNKLHAKIPNGLSAGAGIAIAHKSLPFLTLNALAESLCKFAKKKAKSKGKKDNEPWPSMLAFYVQSQTAEEDYGEHIYPALGSTKLTENPFAVGKWESDTGVLPFGMLLSLAGAIDALPGARGTLRTIRAEIANGRTSVARNLWHRMLTRTDWSNEQEEQLDAFKKAVRTCITDELTEYQVPDCGALFDALELIDVGTLAPEKLSLADVEQGETA
jgi:hypothetical protein